MISVFDARHYLYSRSGKYSCDIQSYLQWDFDIITGWINPFRTLFAKCALLQGALKLLTSRVSSLSFSLKFLPGCTWPRIGVTRPNEGVVSHTYFVFILFSNLFPQKASPAAPTPKGSGSQEEASTSEHLCSSGRWELAYTSLWISCKEFEIVSTRRLRLQWGSKAFTLDNHRTLIPRWWCLNSSGNAESQRQLTWFQFSVQAWSSLELTEVPESCLLSSGETVEARKPEKKKMLLVLPATIL